MPSVDGLYYFAHEADNFSRPAAILIHGEGGQHLFWPPQLRRLPQQRIFTLDLPGHGKSEGVGHHEISDYAAEIINFMRTLNLNQAVLAGHSMGAAVALQVAIHSPKSVLGLALAGGAARFRFPRRIVQTASSSSTFTEAVQMLVEASLGPEANERVRESTAQRLHEARPAVLSGDLLAIEAFDVTDRLSGISTPTLILCGAQDRMTPIKDSEYLRTHIAGARMEVLPHAGHMLMLEQPDKAAEVLAGFLNGIPYQPGN
jgi:pimeloyl-ACP methyl ester carboxylesterase